MRFIRVFAQQTCFANWQDKEPALSKLLQFFEVQPRTQHQVSVSVFEVRSELEELESVAAVFQKTRTCPEKRFGVLSTEEDCRTAGIEIDRNERGNTGIHRIDARHANLIGTPDAFTRLVVEILQRIWEGEQRLRIFPAKQITGQVAVFFKLPAEEIQAASREDCECVLSKANCHQFIEEHSRVNIHGNLSDKRDIPVIATRSYGSLAAPPDWRIRELTRRLRHWWTRR
jgi:hypothetical protein